MTIQDGVITDIERKSGPRNLFILPGFIDAHVHIESSLLCPSRFAEAAVPHGTTSVVTDPHEIANVLGMEGIRYMLRDSLNAPMRIFFTVPSCVPATPIETSGAVLAWREVKEMLVMPNFVALGEVMNVLGVLTEDEGIMTKIEVARLAGKPIDGHAPGLSGGDLDSYVFAGISTDHECTRLEEALEKHRKGMRIMVREGSSSKNLDSLLPFAREHEFFLVSDDLRAFDLQNGHLDKLLRKAVSGGVDPVDAVRSVTIWPAQHYGLPGGTLAVGEVADIVLVNNLEEFKVLGVYIDGVEVAAHGRALFDVSPATIKNGIMEQRKGPEEFEIRAQAGKDKVKVRVMRVVPDQNISMADSAELEVIEGSIRVDPSSDVILLTVVNRYREAPPALGFVRGFNIRKGAIASTVAHDSHNIIAAGVDKESVVRAVNGVSMKGGYFATDGTDAVALELPIAGLMSADRCEAVAAKETEIAEFVRGLGCLLPAPFMTLSFQSLLVEPELKLGDKGLFDSVRFEFVDPVIG